MFTRQPVGWNSFPNVLPRVQATLSLQSSSDRPASACYRLSLDLIQILRTDGLDAWATTLGCDLDRALKANRPAQGDRFALNDAF